MGNRAKMLRMSLFNEAHIQRSITQHEEALRAAHRVFACYLSGARWMSRESLDNAAVTIFAERETLLSGLAERSDRSFWNRYAEMGFTARTAMASRSSYPRFYAIPAREPWNQPADRRK